MFNSPVDPICKTKARDARRGLFYWYEVLIKLSII